MKIINRSAFYEYTILDRFEAGIKLMGTEVKSAKAGHVSLNGAYVKIMGSEVYLINAKIFPYEFARTENYEPARTRKLLLSKNEIISLKSKITGANLTLVPVAVYSKHGLVKVEVGLAKGKKQYEKKQTIKLREQKQEIEREYRGKLD
jgi:SsrA-binding protein